MEKSSKKISIIIPVYNSEKYLVRCVNSVIAQSFTNLEIILVDDGSTDKSLSICVDFKKVDNRIIVLHQENSGPMAAVAYGIKQSTGDYLGFVDSDDWVEQRMFDEMLNCALDNNADIVQCGYYLDRTNSSQEITVSHENITIDSNEQKANLVKRLLNFWSPNDIKFTPSRWNKLIKRRLVVDNIEYCNLSIKMGEDLNMILPILLDCRKIVCTREVYYHYVFNSMSTTHSYLPNIMNQNLDLFKSLEMVLIIKEADYRHELQRYFNYMTINAIWNEMNSEKKFILKSKEIEKICEINPAKDHFREYSTKDFGYGTKIMVFFLKLRLIFFLPIILEILFFFQNLKRAIYD